MKPRMFTLSEALFYTLLMWMTFAVIVAIVIAEQS